MMRSLRRLFALLLCLAVFAGYVPLVSQVYATDGGDDDYTFTVTIYSGKEGTFGGSRKVVRSGLKYDEQITVSLSDLGLEVKNPDKYYPRGLKIAGHDNDEISRYDYNSYTFRVRQDESFSVAYGMKGGMVKYTVNYVDEDGDDLLDSETYYGMVGDYPVVSYKYVEGYTPNAYNLGKTLSSDESKNVFTFTYTEGEDQNQNPNNPNNPNNPGGNNPGANPANANNPGANANANANPGANPGNGPGEVVNLDDGPAPLVEPDKNDPDEMQKQFQWGLIRGGAGLVVLLAVLAFLIAKRRNEEADELAEAAGIADSEEYQKLKDSVDKNSVDSDK